MQNSTHAFHDTTIKGFGNAVMLRRIVCRQAAFSTLLLKVSSEFVTSELTAAIGTKSFDACFVLCLRPGCERLVSIEGFVLRFECVNSSVAGVIVSESDIIS